MKIIRILAGLTIIATLTACTASNKDVVEYGSTFDIKEFLELKEGESANVGVDVDTNVVGTYVLAGDITKDEVSVKTVDEIVQVVDSEKPRIETLQSTDEVFEIPLHDEFQIIGNISAISDAVDGEYSEIQIISEADYTAIIASVKESVKALETIPFTSNEEVAAFKQAQAKNGYTIVTSNLDTSVSGSYVIKITCIDKGYNMIEKSYQVRVVGEAEEIASEKLAAGSSRSAMADISKYQIVDTTKEPEPEVEVEEEKAENSEIKKPTNESNNASQGKEVAISKPPSSSSSNTPVTAQGSPVLQAALDLVGSKMICDQLVTNALVNAGMITGTAESIFKQGSGYNIGVYQFTATASFIAASQAVPGDLIYYNDGGLGFPHIAVYAGNEKAVHGGWNGANVVIESVNVGTGPRYMRFTAISWDDVYKNIYGRYPNQPVITPPPAKEEASIPEIEEPSWEFPKEGASTTYTMQITMDDVCVPITSTTPIDEEFFEAQVNAYASGSITYEQMVAQFTSKGYTITDPF